MKRVRKRIKRSKFIIFVTVIIMLNFIGISYAYWADELSVSSLTAVSTGSIDPMFCGDYLIDVIKGIGDLSVYFEDEYTMVVEGEVETGYKVFLHYCVVNNGSVPVKYKKVNNNVKKGINIIVNQESGVLRQGDSFYSETGNSKLHIEAKGAGRYEDTIELPFTQWVH